MEQHLTIQKVCDLLQLWERTVYDLCRQGKLPGAAKVGGSWRVKRHLLPTWLDKGGEAQKRKQGRTTK